MITYYNRTRMTAVPTGLLQDTRLSVEAKGFAAILYALGDEGVELSELACQLNMPEERISDVLKELTDTDYLQIRKEGDDEYCLEMRGKYHMPDRTRPIRKEICLNEQELSVVRHKMNQLSTRNFGAYARKMLIDGYIIKVDYTEQKKLAAAVSRAASNINQICRRINSTGHVYEDDVVELKARQTEIWELLKTRQKDEL